MSSRSTPGVASTSAAPVRRRTPIGVDAGTTRLVTVAPGHADPADAVVVDGETVADLYRAFTRATHRLQEAAVPGPDALGKVVALYWPRFRAAFDRAADAVLDVAARYADPVVVVEDLAAQYKPLVACRCGDLQLSKWCPAVVQAVVVERCREADVPVQTVDRDGTSQRCHRCGTAGDLGRTTLECTAPDCAVDAVCRDRSAALTIARRYGRGRDD